MCVKSDTDECDLLDHTILAIYLQGLGKTMEIHKYPGWISR